MQCRARPEEVLSDGSNSSKALRSHMLLVRLSDTSKMILPLSSSSMRMRTSLRFVTNVFNVLFTIPVKPPLLMEHPSCRGGHYWVIYI